MNPLQKSKIPSQYYIFAKCKMVSRSKINLYRLFNKTWPSSIHRAQLLTSKYQFHPQNRRSRSLNERLKDPSTRGFRILHSPWLQSGFSLVSARLQPGCRLVSLYFQELRSPPSSVAHLLFASHASMYPRQSIPQKHHRAQQRRRPSPAVGKERRLH